MTFRESLEQIRETIEKHGDKLINEEMTKQALILPMIEAWGYDTRNPLGGHGRVSAQTTRWRQWSG